MVFSRKAFIAALAAASASAAFAQAAVAQAPITHPAVAPAYMHLWMGKGQHGSGSHAQPTNSIEECASTLRAVVGLYQSTTVSGFCTAKGTVTEHCHFKPRGFSNASQVVCHKP
jgi:Spy/CpxP family protein refolding chaperone